VPPSITSPACLRSAARPRTGCCHALGGRGKGQGCEEVARAAACAPRAEGRLLPLLSATCVLSCPFIHTNGI
jgi:hypothetical protein